MLNIMKYEHPKHAEKILEKCIKLSICNNELTTRDMIAGH